jgi:surface antigen
MKKMLLATIVVLFLPILVGTTTAAVATAPRDPPARALFAWVPEGGFRDAFPFGQCTWWAAYNREVTWGGNARDWLENAKAQGVATADYPSLGAIAVYKPGGQYSEYGHVAIVTAVTPRSYTVSEMNAPVWGRVSTRVIAWPDPNVQGFIPLRARL